MAALPVDARLVAALAPLAPPAKRHQARPTPEASESGADVPRPSAAAAAPPANLGEQEAGELPVAAVPVEGSPAGRGDANGERESGRRGARA